MCGWLLATVLLLFLSLYLFLSFSASLSLLAGTFTRP